LEVTFPNEKLGIQISSSIEDSARTLPVVSSTTCYEEKLIGASILSVNGHELIGSKDTYQRAITLIKESQRPVVINFLAPPPHSLKEYVIKDTVAIVDDKEEEGVIKDTDVEEVDLSELQSQSNGENNRLQLLFDKATTQEINQKDTPPTTQEVDNKDTTLKKLTIEDHFPAAPRGRTREREYLSTATSIPSSPTGMGGSIWYHCDVIIINFTQSTRKDRNSKK